MKDIRDSITWYSVIGGVPLLLYLGSFILFWHTHRVYKDRDSARSQILIESNRIDRLLMHVYSPVLRSRFCEDRVWCETDAKGNVLPSPSRGAWK